MGVIRRLFRWGLALAILTPLSVIVWTALWPLPDIDAAPKVDAIVCLGGGIARDGRLGVDTWRRVQTCAALYEAGKAPVIVVTAGPNPNGTRPGSRAMKTAAVEAGVPPEFVIEEPQAYSTLHNAIYSRDLVPDAQSVILVTEAFHLPRSWASHRWAGFTDIHLIASERIRKEGGFRARSRIIIRESLAIWFNLVRSIVFNIGGLAGLPEDQRLPWLY